MTDQARGKAVQGRVAWQCTCFNARRAARAVTDHYNRVLAPSGVTINHFSLLGALSLHGAVSISDLARLLDLDRTTLSRNLTHLERDGRIAFGRGEDRRQRVVRLTEAGRDAVAAAMPLWQQAQQELQTELGEDAWRDAVADLQRLGDVAFDLAAR